MNIIALILKSSRERRHGRIHSFPGNWVFEPTEAQLARSGDYIHTSKDATGQKMFCINQKAIWCNHPDKVTGYPKDTQREMWYLPMYVCRKCEHYRKGKRRGSPRYPTCAWKGSQDAEQMAMVDTVKAIDDATEFAQDIMGEQT